jgi:UDP-N-acetylmuramate dehydrogenase
VIVAVGLRLSKNWQPVLTYGDLTRLDPATVTARDVFDSVCHMRMTKLPDPKVNGNAGSFFKNPVISGENAKVFWRMANRATLPSGGWQREAGRRMAYRSMPAKGTSVGGAAVHRQQALVLINQRDATSDDVVQLAHYVRQRVGEKFNVWLEPEVRFIGAQVKSMPWRLSREGQYHPVNPDWHPC